MATFRPTNNTCELNFDDKFIYQLALNDKTMHRIADICEAQLKALEQIKDTDKDAFDKAYNLSLDALDEILGDGAGADVMSIFEEPGLLELGQVIDYISKEYAESYKSAFAKNSTPAHAPAASKRGRR